MVMRRTTDPLHEPEAAALAKRLAEKAFPGAFLALYGDLGAGKTAFTQAFAQQLGIAGVMSPTFTIVREHAGALPLFHFDAYRLDGSDALYAIGFEDYLEREGVIAMEWPQNVQDALPKERLEVYIEGCGDAPRTYTFVAFGPRYERMLSEVFE